jgi:hypothetical protein
MAKSISGRLNKTQLSILISLVPLAISLVCSLFYLTSNLGYSLLVFSSRSVFGQTSMLSPSLEVVVWGVALFVILARLGYDLELNVVKGHFIAFAGTALIVAVCGMAIGVVAVILGLLSALALVVVSLVLLSLYILFSSDFFGVSRLNFCLRLLVVAIVVFVLVELAGFFA